MKSKKNDNFVAMTLRLPAAMDDAISTAAFDLGQSKSAFIRLAVRLHLKQIQDQELARLRSRVIR